MAAARKKTVIYLSMYALNSGFDRVLTELTRLRSAGLLPNIPVRDHCRLLKKMQIEINSTLHEQMQRRETHEAAKFDGKQDGRIVKERNLLRHAVKRKGPRRKK